MYIGDFIKQYRDSNGVSIEDFANKAGLTTTEIEVLEKNVQDDGTVVPVAMRQIKVLQPLWMYLCLWSWHRFLLIKN